MSPTLQTLLILLLFNFDPVAINIPEEEETSMSISLALERCRQPCLLLIPVTVIVAWYTGADDMNLEFGRSSIIILCISATIITYTVQRDSSDW